MGTEFAQFREWDHENSLEWFMLDYPVHRAMREYTASLNRLYLERKELWELDFDSKGFEWILADEADKNTIAYKRKSIDGNSITVVINFSGLPQRVSVTANNPEFIFHTGEQPFIEKNGDTHKVEITLSAFSGAIFTEKSQKIKIKI